MTLKELQKLINAAVRSGCANDEVLIVLENDGTHVGRVPSVGVENFQIGFDWENGTVLIQPTAKLKKA